jgi:hypothetical protein
MVCAVTVRSLRCFLLALALAFTALPSARGRDAFVLISGGVSPLQNNYSQYLQARAVSRFFERSYPADSVWIFFGAGNVEGRAPVLGDVRRQVRKDGLILESWLPGALARNRPARREAILGALREEILPAVRDGGTLFLFVGDHGSLTRGKPSESTIDLWGADPDPSSRWGWKYAEHERLTVGELRKVLAEGLGKGRLVFVMTQCFSGGFHFLGIPREPVPDPAWFAGTVPKWAAPVAPAPLPLAAGYTATDHYSIAAGCDPDPDPERWAGYERFLPESLLGIDLFTLAPRGKRRASFHAAHVEATLADKTVDKPHATSERYLERWATLIENRLAKESGLTPRVKKALAAYRRAVDGGKLEARDKILGERLALFARYTRRLAEQAPSVKGVLTAGSRAQLAKAAGPPGTADSEPESAKKARARSSAERRKVWRETLRPAWEEAVLAGKIPELGDAHALEFELMLIAEDKKGSELLFASAGPDPLMPYLFGASGAVHPATADAARAEAVARWGALRRRTIVAWARNAESVDIKAASAKAFPPPHGTAAEDANETQDVIEPDIAAERVLFYRRVLAAWAFLVELGDNAALEQVKRLTTLERTLLPAPRRRPGRWSASRRLR